MDLIDDTTSVSQSLFAPGKLFLFGEWSVLVGGEALIGPTPAGQEGALTLRAASTTSPQRGATFTFLSPDFSEAPRRWEHTPAGWREIGEPTSVGAIDVVGEVVRACHAMPAPEGDVRLEVRGRGLFGASGAGQKFGVGSSGAISALVARALWRASRPVADESSLQAREVIFSAALEGHRRAQAGRGSGADVATSVYGEVIRYRLPEPPGLGAWRSGAQGPEVTVCSPSPEGAAVVAVWTGRSADTRRLMSAMAEFQARDVSGWRRRVGAVGASSEEGIRAWRAGDADALLSAVRGSAAALQALGQDAGVPVVIDVHVSLSRKVAEVLGEGGAVKPSGAGGGDMALVFCRTQAGAREILAVLGAEGYRCFGWIW